MDCSIASAASSQSTEIIGILGTVIGTLLGCLVTYFLTKRLEKRKVIE